MVIKEQPVEDSQEYFSSKRTTGDITSLLTSTCHGHCLFFCTQTPF